MKRPTIFLCHSSRDKAFVRDLSGRLKADGIDTWLDEVEIHVGESIHQKVADGLKRSDFFAIVLSQASVACKWVQDELSTASALEKYSERGIFVLPILIETCDVPAMLLDRRYANFKDDPESAYRELLDAIFHYFGAKVPPVDVSDVRVEEPPVDVLAGLVANPESVRDLPPRHFEELIAQVFANAGYRVELTPITRDGGYDIIAIRDFGLPGMDAVRYVIECKSYRRPVDANQVLRLAHVARREKADRAVMVTTSKFTKDAQLIGNEQRVDLVDYNGLMDWLKLTSKKA